MRVVILQYVAFDLLNALGPRPNILTTDPLSSPGPPLGVSNGLSEHLRA